MSLFLTFLTLTLILEAPFFFSLTHRRWRERLAFWLTANIFSYPPVYFLFPHLGLTGWMKEGLAEVWAPLCEIVVGAIVLQRFGRRDALIVIVANLFSWLVGKLILRLLFG